MSSSKKSSQAKSDDTATTTTEVSGAEAEHSGSKDKSKEKDKAKAKSKKKLVDPKDETPANGKKSKDKSKSKSSSAKESASNSEQKEFSLDDAPMGSGIPSKKKKPRLPPALTTAILEGIVGYLDFVTTFRYGLASTTNKSQVKKLIGTKMDFTNNVYNLDDDNFRFIISNWYGANTTTCIIRRAPLLTDRGVKTIVTQMPKLTKLDLSCCNNIKEEAVKWLAKLPELTQLSLSHTNLNEKSFKQLTKAEWKLTHLNISECNQLTDKCLPYLIQIGANLIDLNISRCLSIGDAFVAGLGALPELVHLRASHLLHCRGFRSLANGTNSGSPTTNNNSGSDDEASKPTPPTTYPMWKKLQALDVTGNSISDGELLDIVKAWTNLQSLRIGWCESLSDEGIAAAVKLLPPTLMTLCFEYTRANEETLAALKQLAETATLKVVNSTCTKVSSKAVSKVLSRAAKRKRQAAVPESTV